mmetsp:Transcript_23462/g.23426  ORF Transcript_23462/g.23426 Transcript_23462/m.23426 type:complete len:104 (+) Transcript_23462:1671-1982(+)
MKGYFNICQLIFQALKQDDKLSIDPRTIEGADLEALEEIKAELPLLTKRLVQNSEDAKNYTQTRINLKCSRARDKLTQKYGIKEDEIDSILAENFHHYKAFRD